MQSLYDGLHGATKKDAEHYFPELKESEDERTKRILNSISNKMSFHLRDIFTDEEFQCFDAWSNAWLEKQGEQKQETSYPKFDFDDILALQCCMETAEKVTEDKELYKKLQSLHSRLHDAYWLEKQGKQEEPQVEDGEKITYFETAGYKLVPKFKVKYAGREYNVLEVKDVSGVTFYGIEDEPNHIDYVKAENCEIISVYAIKENGSPYPTKPAAFSEQKPWSEEDEKVRRALTEMLHDTIQTEFEKYNTTKVDCLVWLRKQGEKSSDKVLKIRQELYQSGYNDGYKHGCEDTKKQSEQKPIMNVPSREVILSIWDLGNEWKELTKGSISIEYGTQLNYIQKHWHESEYYLREKQGEQKLPIEKLPSEMKTIGESLGFTTQEECDKYNQIVSNLIMSDDNKDKTKFKVGDWVVRKDGKPFFNGNHYAQITVIDKEQYWFDSGTWLETKDIRLWTIQDAKDGDVLINGSNIFIFHFINDTRLMGYCHVNTDDGRFYDDIGKNECFCLIDAVVNPATKEQRDTLMKAMTDAGWKFDFKKKELMKIEFSDVGHEYYSELLKNDKSDNIADYAYQCAYCMSHDWAIENPTWDNVQSACRLGAKWQKKHDVSEGWSEEDKNLMYDTLSNLTELKDRFGEEYGRTGDCIEWLKSLKDRYTWKPSDDDINLLKEVEQALLGKDCHNRLVDFMWKLKKLKE
jgi:hypothetical protein